MAGQALGGKRADEGEECQPATADFWWIWADRPQAVCNNSQPHQSGSAGLHTDHHQLKKQQQLPRRVSIPDILNMQGQVARCYAETCFQKFVSDKLQRLRGLSEADLIKDFTQLKLNLRQGFVSTGMGDLQKNMLTLTEAKKRKAHTVLQSKTLQRLLQAEQPRLIGCAA